MRSHWKPQLLPPCMKYQPSPSLAISNPTAKGPTPTGVTISRTVAGESTRFDLAEQRQLHLDREPAPDRSASSTGRPPPARDRRATGRPCARPCDCARAPPASRARGGNGCSKVLLVMPIGSSTHSRATSRERLADGVHRAPAAESSPRRPSTRSRCSGCALQPHGAEVRGGCTPSRICWSDRQRRASARSRGTRSRLRFPTCGSSACAA